MSGAGEFYLGLVLAGFGVFALVLAYQSSGRSGRRAVPALAPARSPAADGALHPG